MPCPPKMIFRTPRALGLAAVLTAMLLAPGSGRAEPFSPDILKSVVSLLPEWPGGGSRSKEPEGTAVAIMPGGVSGHQRSRHRPRQVHKDQAGGRPHIAGGNYWPGYDD